MENKNIITFSSCKLSQKKTNIEAQENLLALRLYLKTKLV